MPVQSTTLKSVNRDAYWQTTEAQLKSAQKRGDLFSLLGLAFVGLVIWQFNEPGDNVGTWAAGIATIALALVGLPQLFAARHKRRISRLRGMNCPHCGYVPHDTEISEIARTRECNRCQKRLG